MTLILNILHKDMSILAADRLAIEGHPVTTTPDTTDRAGGGTKVHDYKKITMNPSRSLALGIAGQTQDHYYLPSIQISASIDDALWTIRKHMEGFLRIHDRSGLSALTSFAVNQGIVSFFDQAVGMYFSSKILFSPVQSQIRLYRASDETKIFYAGSGSENFENVVGIDSIDMIKASTRTSCTPKACIEWMEGAYRKVSAADAGTGSEAVFVVSTRSSPSFRPIELLQGDQHSGGVEA